MAEEMLGAAYAPRRSQMHARLQQVKIDICAGSALLRCGSLVLRLAADSSGLRCGSLVLRLAADSSGLKQHNNGSWIVKKWKVKRGFVKLHIMIDMDTKMLALKITDETVGDSTAFEELLDGAPKMIGRAPKASVAEEIEKSQSG